MPGPAVPISLQTAAAAVVVSSLTSFPLVTQEHQALLAKVREGEVALEELQSKNADCQMERDK